MADVIIKVTQNGPYIVEGPVTLIDHLGNPIDTTGRKRVSLCRCGASTTKPFCDGTHSRIGFRGAEEARREFDETHGG